MSGVFEFFEKIQKQILDLQNSIHQFQESWDRFQKFWDFFLGIVPWEVLLLLAFSVILLSLFNSVSPSTPKLNLSLAVLGLAFLWGYFWGLFSESVNYWTIVKAALYILLPLHAIGLGTWGYRFYRQRTFANRRIKPRDWEESLGSISKDYNSLMAAAYSKNDALLENQTEIKNKIADLEKSISGLKGLFP